MVTSEWAIIKVAIATGGAVGAFFSLSRQPEPLTPKSIALCLCVGAMVAFFGTILVMHRLNLPKDDFDLNIGVAGLSAFILGIVSMNLSIFIYSLGVMLRDDPMKLLRLLSAFFGKLSSLFKGDKDA